MPPSLFQRVIGARERFIRAGIPPDQAAIDAEVLARHAAGWDRASYLTRRDEPPDPEVARSFERAVVRREGREPVAYITGRREFWGLDFLVTPAVLIPRPETEFIVEAALARLRDRARPWRIADVGTGSGCLAVALAHELAGSRVTATDISPAALGVARQNAARLGVGARVAFVETSLLDGVPGPFDLIVANPPYVPQSHEPALSPDVRDHEPRPALYGHGEDGLDEVRALLAQAPSRLAGEGVLMMEFGFGQADAVRAELARVEGLRLVEILRDLQGLERTLVAGCPPSMKGAASSAP
jgi:release factor glutamine methyltransferase